ncbi:hypothetical protein ACFXA3_12275 [Streptomyces sp. NPDC059456]|uniref:ATP-dependent DNA ligase n=1 Tax=Streptomyces sp. NPDC059456 TaxID=3346838 RepID=UPI0036AE329F
MAAVAPDTTNATAANALNSTRFISHALPMIVKSWSGRSLGRGVVRGNSQRQEAGEGRCSRTGGRTLAAAGQLPGSLVLDGELVVWNTAAGRLSFEALQRRAAARGRAATALAVKTPAFSSAFDALQIDGIELPALPYAERRLRPEVLFAACALAAPWTPCR